MAKLTNQEFIEKARQVHGGRYDYSDCIYNGAHNKVKIKCSVHGLFEQPPHSHNKGSGCPKCAYIVRRNSVQKDVHHFIAKGNIVHNYFYDYRDSVYVNNRTKLKINCRLHGIFEQAPAQHLSGRGCPSCGSDKLSQYNSKNPSGWGLSSWQKSAKNSKDFDSFKVYLFKCTDEHEQFYKIGRTYRKVADRAYDIPYTIEVLHEIKHKDAKIIFDLETQLKREYKCYRYTPKRKFNGKRECFSLELPISTIITNYPTNYTPKIDDAPTPTP
jgi:hypothetical protein